MSPRPPRNPHVVAAAALVLVVYLVGWDHAPDAPGQEVPERVAAERTPADAGGTGEHVGTATKIEWREVRVPQGVKPRKVGISGLAPAGDDGRTLLVVHDGKDDDDPRVSVLTIAGAAELRPIDWPGKKPPKDLEAIARVPGSEPAEYLVLTSSGTGFRLRPDLAAGTMAVTGRFHLPRALDDELPSAVQFEALTVVGQSDGAYRCVWAHRGTDASPAEVHWGELRFEGDGADGKAAAGVVRWLGYTDFRAPWPATAVRSVSDLCVAPGGELWAAAASDPGGDGPFESALYTLGTLTWSTTTDEPKVTLDGRRRRRSAPDDLAGYKVEALWCDGGSLVLGTDDENHGGSVATIPVSPPPN